MLLALNAPLRIGQRLTRRGTPASSRPTHELTGHNISGGGILWLVKSGSGEEWMSLSEIFKAFKFDDE